MRYVHTSKKGKKTARRGTGPGAPAEPAPATLSDALATFADPLLALFQQMPGERLLRSVFSLAMLAWNEGNPQHPVPLREGMRIRDRVAQEFGSAWADVAPYYQELIRSRRERFGEDRRVITDFHLEHGADGKWKLFVAGGELGGESGPTHP
jgi:hypothetical protein